LKYYRSGEFDRAIKQFKEALVPNPGDRLSATYVERCEAMIANPPEGEWNGIRIMDSK
jgi:adenylate cyclase